MTMVASATVTLWRAPRPTPPTTRIPARRSFSAAKYSITPFGPFARMKGPANPDSPSPRNGSEDGDWRERDRRRSAVRDGFYVHFGYIFV